MPQWGRCCARVKATGGVCSRFQLLGGLSKILVFTDAALQDGAPASGGPASVGTWWWERGRPNAVSVCAGPDAALEA